MIAQKRIDRESLALKPRSISRKTAKAAKETVSFRPKGEIFLRSPHISFGMTPWAGVSFGDFVPWQDEFPCFLVK